MSDPIWQLGDWQQGYDEGRRVGVKTALDERDHLKAENEVLTLRVMAGERHELAALKSAPVVMPNRMTDGAADYAYSRYSAGWNACLDEFARLNGGKP